MERSDIPLFRKSSWATAGRTRLDFLERESKVQMERSDIPLFRKSSWATAGQTRLDFLERESKVQTLASHPDKRSEAEIKAPRCPC
jgi:hypothetical protein